MTDLPLWAARMRDDGATSIVSLTGELDLTMAGDLRRSLVAELDRPGIDTVVADLAGVSFLDSAALGALIAAYHHAGDLDRRFVVAEPVHAVRRVLEIAGVHDLLTGSDLPPAVAE